VNGKSFSDWHDSESLRRDSQMLQTIIGAVGNKYPGETRYETALRYIEEREASISSENA